jgi:hypothetical protein
VRAEWHAVVSCDLQAAAGLKRCAADAVGKYNDFSFKCSVRVFDSTCQKVRIGCLQLIAMHGLMPAPCRNRLSCCRRWLHDPAAHMKTKI